MQKKRQALIAGILLATLSIAVTGCKKEPTQEEVEKSEYYTDLLSQYNKVKKQNKKLEAARRSNCRKSRRYRGRSIA